MEAGAPHGHVHGEGGPVPESMKEFLEAIHAGCSIDIYNEGNEHLGDTFLQSIDQMAMVAESHEAQSISSHIKQGGNNHSHGGGGGDNETAVPWTYESILMLVKTVEKYPELWDNQYMYSIYSRHASWETVAATLNASVEEFKIHPVTPQDVTSKWRRLRGQKTIMEKNKHKHGMKRTPRIPNEFSYYNHMDFIFYPPSKRAQDDGIAFPTEKLSQHESKVKWNYMSSMALITEVKKYPVIWASSKGHPPSSARTKAYCAVLDHLNTAVPAFVKTPITMNDLRWKWKNLRGYMNRCCKNLKKGNSNSEWEFFHAMEFLYPNHFQQIGGSRSESSHDQVRIKEERKADANTSNMEGQKMTADSYPGNMGGNQNLLNLQTTSSNNENGESHREAGEPSSECVGMDKEHQANEVQNSKRKWNYETTMTIITEIKKYPVIWDTSSSVALIEEKFAAYESIISYLNSSVPAFIVNPITLKDLTWKWKHLRNYKMRCMRSLTTNPNMREWEFSSALEFIEANCSEQTTTKPDSSCVSVDSADSRVHHKKSNEELYRVNQDRGSANENKRKSNVRWNRIKTMALIAEVKKYPKLWNVESRQSASYNFEVYSANKLVIAHLNETIPDFKNNPITIRDLIFKWKNLRAYKMRCMRNLKTNPNLRRWEFFAPLHFLEGIVSEQASIKQDSTGASSDNVETDCKNVDEEFYREKQDNGSANDKSMDMEEKAGEEAQDSEDANTQEQPGDSEKSNVRWNYVRTMALINEVKKHIVLWNDNSRHNATYVAKVQAANQKVVNILNSSEPEFIENPITVKDMKLKWRHLRQYARRCMRTKSNTGKEWEFYNALDFLIAETPKPKEMPKSEVKWNRHSIMALITEVKKYPELWHYSNKAMDHTDKYNMFKAQKHIVAHLNATVPSFRKNRITISDMRYKWRCLRGYMSRCLKAEFTTGKKWEFYNALLFLDPNHTPDNSVEDSTSDASNNKDYYNPYEPAIELNYDSTDEQMDQSPEELAKNQAEGSKKPGSVPSHSVLPRHLLEGSAPQPLTPAAFGAVSSSSDLCAVALLQIKHAFSQKHPSEEKQMHFYQAISQLCAQFIGGSERRSNTDREPDN